MCLVNAVFALINLLNYNNVDAQQNIVKNVGGTWNKIEIIVNVVNNYRVMVITLKLFIVFIINFFVCNIKFFN